MTLTPRASQTGLPTAGVHADEAAGLADVDEELEDERRRFAEVLRDMAVPRDRSHCRFRNRSNEVPNMLAIPV